MFRLLAHPALPFLQVFLTMLRRPSGMSCTQQTIPNPGWQNSVATCLP